ncbi:hypothetical protein MOX02_29710 [Methylobacterium oxalidis]|uniref:Uncharacterized protein n=1 Tax=Methylobacterium oxalidis TaxID=944322 RepID=A0A512J4S4_9HYPH|nr:hypothetical protein MOX02_29710 [Methylobacterium oxalidis]
MSASHNSSKAAQVAARHNRALWRVHTFEHRRLTAGLHRGSREHQQRTRSPEIKRRCSSGAKCSEDADAGSS